MKREKWFLAGPPFSGKSTVGVLLSKMLGCPFIDLDGFIEEREGMSVETLFLTCGEEGFRRLESGCLAEIAGREVSMVVALGGGTLLKPENVSIVNSAGVLFTLCLPEREIIRRISGGRPLAAGPGELRSLLKARKEHYLGLPGRIRTGGMTPGEIAALIAERVRSTR